MGHSTISLPKTGSFFMDYVNYRMTIFGFNYDYRHSERSLDDFLFDVRVCVNSWQCVKEPQSDLNGKQKRKFDLFSQFLTYEAETLYVPDLM